MRVKRLWGLQSFLVCVLCNALLLVGLFLLAKRQLAGIQQWADPLLDRGAARLPLDLLLTTTKSCQCCKVCRMLCSR
jgi:hypothetical protein